MLIRALLFFSAGLLVACSGVRPNNLGITENKQLRSCPNTPNCVNTFAPDKEHAIAPILYTGTLAQAKAKLIRVINQMPRTRIITNSSSYLHVEYTTALWRFVDDVEFYLDDNSKVIHFRSASRLGKSDLGTNRSRMEKLRQLFAADAN